MGTYEDFNSPYGVSRSIHPGAVLLSPQLSSTSTPAGTITNNNNSTSGTTTNINNLSNAFNNMNIMNNNNTATTTTSTTTHTDVSNISNTLIDDTNNNNNYNYNNDNHNINIHNNNNDINNNNMMTAGSVSNNNNTNNKNNGLINLTQDINNICKWLTNMSSAQQNMVMDNIISTLKDDVLQYTKLKLDSLTNSGYLSSPPQPPIITSPLSVPLLNELNNGLTNTNNANNNNNNNLPPPSSSSNSTNMNSILSNEHTTTSTTNNNINKESIYHPWSPQPILEQQQARLLQQRPKSADPTNYQFQQNNDIGMISTLSQQTLRNENLSGRHLNIHNNSNYTNNSNNSNYSNNNNTTSYNTNNNTSTSPNQYQHNVSYNRSLNNRKIYSDPQYQQPYSYQSTGLHSYNNFYSFTKAHQNKHRHTDDNNNLQQQHQQQQHQQQQKSPANTSMNPKNLTDPNLLLDIPMWLKSLRLHKYSAILKDYYWEDLIELDDDFLNKKGVVALGARRKLLKAFTIVKDLKNKGEIDQKAFNSDKLSH
ncbi:hypothetical protein C6P45_004134 [Maudiozyma exigua]|uniref:SAM domain-containing protein n=1 Tax=Maudiozyma exigua TaxID=34358 RepID=A0A9P6WFG7_MAUEX|nr:hypothetical protein C6P45_004134 [Kazachstania exigua]